MMKVSDWKRICCKGNGLNCRVVREKKGWGRKMLESKMIRYWPQFCPKQDRIVLNKWWSRRLVSPLDSKDSERMWSQSSPCYQWGYRLHGVLLTVEGSLEVQQSPLSFHLMGFRQGVAGILAQEIASEMRWDEVTLCLHPQSWPRERGQRRVAARSQGSEEGHLALIGEAHNQVRATAATDSAAGSNSGGQGTAGGDRE